jgi:hypothetical protein
MRCSYPISEQGIETLSTHNGFKLTSKNFDSFLADSSNWDKTARLTFTDKAFERELSAADFHVGQRVYFKVDWMDFHQDFTVLFYVDKDRASKKKERKRGIIFFSSFKSAQLRTQDLNTATILLTVDVAAF